VEQKKRKMRYHKCNALMEDLDALGKNEDLGLPKEDTYVRTRFLYAEVDGYHEWIEDEFGVEVLKGTVVYVLGRMYQIDTSLDNFDAQIEAYEKEINIFKYN